MSFDIFNTSGSFNITDHSGFGSANTISIINGRVMINGQEVKPNGGISNGRPIVNITIEGQKTLGNIRANACGMLKINGNCKTGDIDVKAGNISVSGDVKGNVTCQAGNVTVMQNVEGNVGCQAGNITHHTDKTNRKRRQIAVSDDDDDDEPKKEKKSTKAPPQPKSSSSSSHVIDIPNKKGSSPSSVLVDTADRRKGCGDGHDTEHPPRVDTKKKISMQEATRIGIKFQTIGSNCISIVNGKFYKGNEWIGTHPDGSIWADGAVATPISTDKISSV